MKRLLVFLTACVSVVPLCMLLYATARVLLGFAGSFPPDAHAECGLVFGAAVHSIAHPGPAILRRTEAGVRLYNDGRVDRLIFTGGKGSDVQDSEAEVMRGVAIGFGVLTGSITLETRSSSTWENITYSKPLLEQCDSFVGISDYYHLARISLIAQRQGIDLPTYPASASYEVIGTKSVLREIAGYILYLSRILP